MERQFGPYRLVEQIAVGGMAEIHLAKTEGIAGFEKYVALKMIHPNFSEDQQFIEMLIDEAKITVQLQHANIAQTFDLGRVGETYYITMEFVDGADLYKLLRKSSEYEIDVPTDVAAHIAKEVATGLDYAHRKRDMSGNALGIVHRDVSPQNVLVSRSGEVKLVDFGIAKATMRARQTAVGVIKGKYYYMSPEQAWGDQVDHRTDIFSTGILLYELLTGQMLYLEEDLQKLLHMVRKAEIKSPVTLRQDIPPQLEKIVMHALESKADERYQTAGQLATDLERFLHVYSPVFTASKVNDWVNAIEAVEPPPPEIPVSPEPIDQFRQTRRVTDQQLVRQRSEIHDENSVIFNIADMAKERAKSESAKGKVVKERPATGPRNPRQKTKASGLDDDPGDDLTTPERPGRGSRPPEVTPSKPPGQPPRPAPRAPTGTLDDASVTDVEAIENLTAKAIESSAAPPMPMSPAPMYDEVDATVVSGPPQMAAMGRMLAGQPGAPPSPPARVPFGGQAPLDTRTVVDEVESVDVPTIPVEDDDDDMADFDGPTLAHERGDAEDIEAATVNLNKGSGASAAAAAEPFDSGGTGTATKPARPGQWQAAPALDAANPKPAVSAIRPPKPSRRTPPNGIPAQPGNVLSDLISSNRGTGGRRGPKVMIEAPPEPEPPPGPNLVATVGVIGNTPAQSQPAHPAQPRGRSPQMTPGYPRATGYPAGFTGGSPGLSGQLAAVELEEIPDAYKIKGGPSKRTWWILGGIGGGALLIGAIVLAFALGGEESEHGRTAVEVVSAPEGGTVSVDGVELPEKTPTSFSADRGKTYVITVDMPKHERYSREVNIPVDESDKMTLVAKLQPILVTLRIISRPDGAEVFLRGESKGRTPLELPNLNPDTTKVVELRKKGFRPVRHTLDWSDETEKVLNIDLTK